MLGLMDDDNDIIPESAIQAQIVASRSENRQKANVWSTRTIDTQAKVLLLLCFTSIAPQFQLFWFWLHLAVR